MQLRGRKDTFTIAAALLVAGIVGGTLALAGASVVGVGQTTTTIRDVLQDPAPGARVVASESRGTRALTIAQIYDRYLGTQCHVGLNHGFRLTVELKHARGLLRLLEGKLGFGQIFTGVLNFMLKENPPPARLCYSWAGRRKP